MLTLNYFNMIWWLGRTQVNTWGSGELTSLSNTKKSFSNLGIISGGSQLNYSFLAAMPHHYNPTESGPRGVQFGSGTTPPTKNDHCLENPIDNGSLSVYPSNVMTVNEDDYFEFQATYNIKALTDVTISEIGLVANLYTSAVSLPCLIDRTLLDEPVTLQTNETAVIKYALRFYY